MFLSSAVKISSPLLLHTTSYTCSGEGCVHSKLLESNDDNKIGIVLSTHVCVCVYVCVYLQMEMCAIF